MFSSANKIKLLILIGISLVVAGCMKVPLKPVAKPYHPPKMHLYSLHQFNRLNLSGDIRVSLVPGRGKLGLKTTTVDAQQLKLKEEKGVLAITGAAAFNTVPVVIIHVPVLRQITVADNVSLQANNIVTKHLLLRTDSTNPVNLKGTLNLSSLTQTGAGKVSLQWVQGDAMTLVSSGPGAVALAGVAGHMKVLLSGHSRLDAKYLRAQYIDMQTKGEAQANVTPLRSLNAYADNSSSIYYYHLPAVINQSALTPTASILHVKP